MRGSRTGRERSTISVMNRQNLPSMAVAIAALIVWLTGTGIAAYTLPRNSVGTAQLKEAAVTNTRLANNSVGTKRIKNNAVTSLKIRNRTIQKADLSWDLWQELETKVGRTGPAGPGGLRGRRGRRGLRARRRSRPSTPSTAACRNSEVRRLPGRPSSLSCSTTRTSRQPPASRWTTTFGTGGWPGRRSIPAHTRPRCERPVMGRQRSTSGGSTPGPRAGATKTPTSGPWRIRQRKSHSRPPGSK